MNASTNRQQASTKNQPLLAQLSQMVDAAEPLAAAIADNAWDDAMSIPADVADALAIRLRRMAGSLAAAACVPTRAEMDGLRLPSMSGKELV